MCRRFEQLRLEFAPRPAAHRAEARATTLSAAPDEWRPPTPAEYRAALAQRRARSTSADQSRGRVIRTPGLTQNRVEPPPGSARAAGDEVLPSPVRRQPPVNDQSPTSPKIAKRRKSKDGGRREARARGRSQLAAESNKPAPPISSPASSSADVPAVSDSASSPSVPEPRGVAIAPQGRRASPHVSRTLPRAARVRTGASRSRTVVRWPALVVGAIVVAVSALIGAAVPILLSLR